MVSDERRGWPAQVRNLVSLFVTSGAIALVRNRSEETREAMLRSLMRAHDLNGDLFDPTHPNGRALHRRERPINSELIRRGFFAQDSAVEPGALFRIERVTATSNAVLFQEMEALNRALNERHGTHLPSPELVIVDNERQIPAYIVDSDQIVLSRDLVERGHAPGMIAHELAERLNHFTHGDRRLIAEFTFSEALNLPIPEDILQRHRSNECREDANAAALVGPARYREALAYVLRKIRPLPNAEEISSDARSSVDPVHYPTDRQRLRMLDTLAARPELLRDVMQRPLQVQFDGVCNMTVVEQHGAGVAPNGGQLSNNPIPAR